MATNKFYTEGIVLSEMKYGDSSKIIRLFTKEKGKISIMAKGAFRAKSALLSVTQSFALSNYWLRKGQSFYYILSGELISSNFNIRKNYQSLIYASFLSELVEKSSLEEMKNEKIFELFNKTMTLLNEEKDPLGLILAFELKYLTFLGYRPRLTVGQQNYFSFQEGVLHDEQGQGRPLTSEDVYYLQSLLYTSLDEKLSFDEKRKSYLHELFLQYIKYNLEINEFHSLKLI
ncbi:MAG: DNA repair protein RecO [Tissierellia bacterium]|nr:DNA repair protein RecO [Tissierellia bacterium]